MLDTNYHESARTRERDAFPAHCWRSQQMVSTTQGPGVQSVGSERGLSSPLQLTRLTLLTSARSSPPPKSNIAADWKVRAPTRQSGGVFRITTIVDPPDQQPGFAFSCGTLRPSIISKVQRHGLTTRTLLSISNTLNEPSAWRSALASAASILSSSRTMKLTTIGARPGIRTELLTSDLRPGQY